MLSACNGNTLTESTTMESLLIYHETAIEEPEYIYDEAFIAKPTEEAPEQDTTPRFQAIDAKIEIDGCPSVISAYFDNMHNQFFYPLEDIARKLSDINISFFNYSDYIDDFIIVHYSDGKTYARYWDFAPHVDFEIFMSYDNNILYLFTYAPYVSESGLLALKDFLYDRYPQLFMREVILENFGEGIENLYAIDFTPFSISGGTPWIVIRFTDAGSTLSMIYAFHNGEYHRAFIGSFRNLFRDSQGMVIRLGQDSYEEIVFIDSQAHIVPASPASPLYPSRSLPDLIDTITNSLNQRLQIYS